MTGLLKYIPMSVKLLSGIVLLAESLSHESAGAEGLLGILSAVPLAWIISSGFGPESPAAAADEVD